MWLEILPEIRFRDVVDILVVAFIIYRILILIQGTRAIQMLLGLATIVIVFILAQWFQLATLEWALSNILGDIFLVIIVLFQSDIRRALTRVGKNPFATGGDEFGEEVVEEISRAANALANRKIGAIIVVERNTGLNEYIEDGVAIDAKVSRDLMISAFLPTSPIHDGAMIIRGGRIVAAGCFFPLATDVEIDKDLGTRHRAAIGISEESDAAVVVVSEEKGAVSLIYQGKIFFNLDGDNLRERLHRLLV